MKRFIYLSKAANEVVEKLETDLAEARAQIAKLEAENKKWVELMERRGELIFGREGD